VGLWREWQVTHERVQELSQRLQYLEVALAERFDTFGTVVPVPGGSPARVYCLSDLHSLFGDRPDLAEIRLQAERELAAKQADFDSVSAELDYFPTMEAEQEAFTRAKALLERMAELPAHPLQALLPSSMPWPAGVRPGTNDQASFPGRKSDQPMPICSL
jgi:hypothetical protein